MTDLFIVVIALDKTNQETLMMIDFLEMLENQDTPEMIDVPEMIVLEMIEVTEDLPEMNHVLKILKVRNS